MIASISVSWAAKRNERHASTKPPAVTDSHLWANAYTKMNRGREKWRQTGAEAFCFPPRCCDLTWARRRWYICSPAKLASLRLSDSTGIHVVWQRMHKQKRNLGLSQNTLITSLLRGIRPRKEKRGGVFALPSMPPLCIASCCLPCSNTITHFFQGTGVYI